MTPTFHRAYDKFLMAITPDYEIVLSDEMLSGAKDETTLEYLRDIQGRHIIMPEKFAPSNREFWVAKIRRNKERDKEEQRKLAAMGWQCITVWECELKPSKREETLESIAFTLNHIFLQDHGISPRPQITRIPQIGQMEEESENYLKAAEEEI